MDNSKSIGVPAAVAGEQGAAPAGKSYVLAIGINRYRHLPPLYNAVKDVQEVVRLLTAKYQFDPEPETCTILLDDQATRRRIYAALDTLTGKLTPQDNLLLYYSGHGTYREHIDEGFWIPVDGDLDDPGSFIPNSTIIKYLKAIKAQHIVVISDACFSGALFTERAVAPEKRQYNVPSRWLLTSGRNEVVSDGRPGQNSPFADSLLLHLAENRETGLRITQLANIILEDVGSNNVQLPRCEPLRDVGHRGGEFLFWLKGREDRTERLQPRPAGATALPVPLPAPWWKKYIRELALGAAIALVAVLLLSWPFLFPKGDKTTFLAVSPGGVHLGAVENGTVKELTISLRNPGPVAAILDSVRTDCPNLVLTDIDPKILNAGAQGAIRARWTARQPGKQHCTLTVYGRNLARPIPVIIDADVYQKPSPTKPEPAVAEPPATQEKARTKPEKPVPAGESQGSGGEPAPVETVRITDFQTRVPANVSMYLIVDKTGEKINAVARNNYLIFQAPETLRGQRVTVYFERNEKQDKRTLRLGRDEINLPESL